MKRIGNIFEKIVSIENLRLADANAQKGKSNQYGVLLHNKNRETNILALHTCLKDKLYCTSKYDVFTVYEPKERTVYRLPYYPDRITHHAIMNILEPIFVDTFTADTYSCIKGRGIHAAANAVKIALKDKAGTMYCLKLDITKFYPSVDHRTLKRLLRKKIKDDDVLWLLDEIIESAPGLPIGNYLSQYLANFYLTYFDHWLKEQKRVKYYFRYADDLVILAPDKPYLHGLLSEIKSYLAKELKLCVKGNYQVFPVEKRGIDFVGYKFYHSHTLLRKGIKQRFARMLKNNPNKASIDSYLGWAKHCDSNNLLKTLLPNETV
nr:RNA-directed DNA polymerase [Allomuricauda sp.]